MYNEDQFRINSAKDKSSGVYQYVFSYKFSAQSLGCYECKHFVYTSDNKTLEDILNAQVAATNDARCLETRNKEFLEVSLPDIISTIYSYGSLG